jgi:hypothetical protein
LNAAFRDIVGVLPACSTTLHSHSEKHFSRFPPPGFGFPLIAESVSRGSAIPDKANCFRSHVLVVCLLNHSEIYIKMAAAVRALVSQDRNRFQQDGFDLDLTYITPQIIGG